MWKFLKSISLTKWILIAMVIGVFIGFLAPEFSANLKVFSNIFLRMIKSIIVPILFATLVVAGPWLLTVMTDYMRQVFESIPAMVG